MALSAERAAEFRAWMREVRDSVGFTNAQIGDAARTVLFHVGVDGLSEWAQEAGVEKMSIAVWAKQNGIGLEGGDYPEVVAAAMIRGVVRVSRSGIVDPPTTSTGREASEHWIARMLEPNSTIHVGYATAIVFGIISLVQARPEAFGRFIAISERFNATPHAHEYTIGKVTMPEAVPVYLSDDAPHVLGVGLARRLRESGVLKNGALDSGVASVIEETLNADRDAMAQSFALMLQHRFREQVHFSFEICSEETLHRIEFRVPSDLILKTILNEGATPDAEA